MTSSELSAWAQSLVTLVVPCMGEEGGRGREIGEKYIERTPFMQTNNKSINFKTYLKQYQKTQDGLGEEK